jgi:hypothetical protein
MSYAMHVLALCAFICSSVDNTLSSFYTQHRHAHLAASSDISSQHAQLSEEAQDKATLDAKRERWNPTAASTGAITSIAPLPFLP